MSAVTIGTDPEVFLRSAQTQAQYPVCGLIGGTKDEPLPFPEDERYRVQEDNVMLEFNTPPVITADDFADTIGHGIELCRNLVRTRNPDLSLYDGAHELLFPHELIQQHPGAMRFGCSPDFDAYNSGAAYPALDPSILNEGGGQWRFAGGHVHIGYQNPNDVPHFVVASFADIFLGLASLGLDEQPKRRQLYGQPGRYRPTAYGIEYRTLSNFWIWEGATRYEVGLRALRLGSYIQGSTESQLLSAFRETPWADVRQAIQTEDSVRAADILVYCVEELRIRAGGA